MGGRLAGGARPDGGAPRKIGVTVGKDQLGHDVEVDPIVFPVDLVTPYEVVAFADNRDRGRATDERHVVVLVVIDEGLRLHVLLLGEESEHLEHSFAPRLLRATVTSWPALYRAGHAVAGDLPPTIHAVLAARIDALPGDARTALLRASVIGKVFWSGVLAKVGGIPDIEGALEALEMRGLIQQSSYSQVEGDVEFSFKHDLVLDTAYSTLPRASRRELHATTASALEELVHQPDEMAPILAHHWRESGDAARSCHYLLIAADRARQALAVEETYDLYSQALELVSEEVDRSRIRFLRAQALVQLEDFARAADELAELIPLLVGEEQVEAIVARAHAALWTERTNETMTCAQRDLTWHGREDSPS